jgi:hypothetical protein
MAVVVHNGIMCGEGQKSGRYKSVSRRKRLH